MRATSGHVAIQIMEANSVIKETFQSMVEKKCDFIPSAAQSAENLEKY